MNRCITFGMISRDVLLCMKNQLDKIDLVAVESANSSDKWHQLLVSDAWNIDSLGLSIDDFRDRHLVPLVEKLANEIKSRLNGNNLIVFGELPAHAEDSNVFTYCGIIVRSTVLWETLTQDQCPRFVMDVKVRAAHA